MKYLRAGAAIAWLTTGTPALAHSPVPGIEGFYIGLLHPFSTPAQALLMLGLGLFMAGLTSRQTRAGLGFFFVAVLIGILPGIVIAEPDTAMFALAMAVCALAALWPATALPVALGMVVLAGVFIGQVSIPDAGPARDRIITMSGSFVGANIGLLYIAGGISFVRERYSQPWVDIGFRVAAAWLGAVSLVMLALRYAPQSG